MAGWAARWWRARWGGLLAALRCSCLAQRRGVASDRSGTTGSRAKSMTAQCLALACISGLFSPRPPSCTFQYCPRTAPRETYALFAPDRPHPRLWPLSAPCPTPPRPQLSSRLRSSRSPPPRKPQRQQRRLLLPRRSQRPPMARPPQLPQRPRPPPPLRRRLPQRAPSLPPRHHRPSRGCRCAPTWSRQVRCG